MVLGSMAGTAEFYKILTKKFNIHLRKLPFAGAYLPIAAYLEMAGMTFPGFTSLILIILVSILMTREVFLKDQNDINNVIVRLASSIMILIYPGFFMTYIIKISIFQDASYLIFLFMILVFINDSMAFVGGSLFGRKTRKLFIVSPNKSAAGFISGFIFTISAGLLFKIIFPVPVSYWQVIILSIACSISSNAGDLIESAIKRSADVKDSGNLMPGRGGILDSIDSMLFSAPAYYFILLLFLN